MCLNVSSSKASPDERPGMVIESSSVGRVYILLILLFLSRFLVISMLKRAQMVQRLSDEGLPHHDAIRSPGHCIVERLLQFCCIPSQLPVVGSQVSFP